jgi:hypothetical protein
VACADPLHLAAAAAAAFQVPGQSPQVTLARVPAAPQQQAKVVSASAQLGQAQGAPPATATPTASPL